MFYLIQNNTIANFLALNPSNTVEGNGQRGAPLAFFSLEAANPDGMQHTPIIADSTTGTVQHNWEDLLSLGDSDFNDAAITVQPSGSSSAHAALHAPGTDMTAVALSATLNGEKSSMPSGDLGVYYADDQNGTVGGLSPGDAGYTAAALAPGNFPVLFTAGIGGTQQASVPAGKYLAFYFLTSGTTSEFFSNNPTNSSAGAGLVLVRSGQSRRRQSLPLVHTRPTSHQPKRRRAPRDGQAGRQDQRFRRLQHRLELYGLALLARGTQRREARPAVAGSELAHVTWIAAHWCKSAV